jgi:hypothetical protein
VFSWRRGGKTMVKRGGKKEKVKRALNLRPAE